MNNCYPNLDDVVYAGIKKFSNFGALNYTNHSYP